MVGLNRCKCISSLRWLRHIHTLLEFPLHMPVLMMFQGFRFLLSHRRDKYMQMYQWCSSLRTTYTHWPNFYLVKCIFLRIALCDEFWTSYLKSCFRHKLLAFKTTNTYSTLKVNFSLTYLMHLFQELLIDENNDRQHPKKTMKHLFLDSLTLTFPWQLEK